MDTFLKELHKNLFNNIDGILIVMVLIIPGLISIKARDHLVTELRKDHQNLLLDILVYNIFNYILVLPALYLSYKYYIKDNYPWLFYLIIVLLIFVTPILWVLLYKKATPYLKHIISPIPKAWDYVFSLKKQYWVLITLKSGKLIGGLYDKNSFTSSYPDEQDIYLSKVWEINECGEFIEEVEGTEGLLIKDREIEYMEFFEYEKENING